MTKPRLSPTPQERRVIVGDTHGDYVRLRDILERTEVIASDGTKVGGVWSCHIGDVIHGGHGVQADDTRCLELALSAFDCLILGNHEAACAYGIGRFAGINDRLECQALLDESVRNERWTPATSADNFLVVHAGLHPQLAQRSSMFADLRRRGELGDPSALARALRAGFLERVRTGAPDAVFDAIGPRRGGRDPHGGVLWCDWGELMKADIKRPSPVAQIVGHTPRRHVQQTADGRFWCIDVGAALSRRLGAIVRDPSAAQWSPIEVTSASLSRGRS